MQNAFRSSPPAHIPCDEEVTREAALIDLGELLLEQEFALLCSGVVLDELMDQLRQKGRFIVRENGKVHPLRKDIGIALIGQSESV